jgi:hypothetical protein
MTAASRCDGGALMQMARGRLWMILPRLEVLRPHQTRRNAKRAGSRKAGNEGTPVENYVRLLWQNYPNGPRGHEG